MHQDITLAQLEGNEEGFSNRDAPDKYKRIELLKPFLQLKSNNFFKDIL